MSTRHGAASWNLFAYGTLQVVEVMARVIGRTVVGQPALLDGYRCCRIVGEVYPGLRRQPGWRTSGVLYCGLCSEDLEALDRFEGEEYCREPLTVLTEEQQLVAAFVYVSAPGSLERLTDEAWSLDEFRRQGLGCFMDGYGGFRHDPPAE